MGFAEVEAAAVGSEGLRLFVGEAGFEKAIEVTFGRLKNSASSSTLLSRRIWISLSTDRYQSPVVELQSQLTWLIDLTIFNVCGRGKLLHNVQFPSDLAIRRMRVISRTLGIIVRSIRVSASVRTDISTQIMHSFT